MKKRSLLLFCLLCCVGAACSLQHQRAVGSDSDRHGCKASAGYQYSALRGACVRPWEEGIALSAAADAQVPLSSRAYVLLSADGTQAELFWTLGEQTVLKRGFTPQGPFWHKGAVRLERLPEGWLLYQDGRLLFSAPNPPQE